MSYVRTAAARWYVLLSLVAGPAAAHAQGLPSGPLTLGGGRLAISAQASASAGTEDTGYFNYSTYDYGLLRLFRLDASADLRLNDHVSLLGDMLALASTDSGHWTLRPYAAFARLRPWTGRMLDIQAGLIPPVFGAFSRHAYDTENPLIGYPLAYQYLTSLRSNALPASTADLLKMRGLGWRAAYPIGAATAAEGLPLVDGIRYQTGIEAHAGNLQPLEGSVAWTAGSLSTPGSSHGNLGRQLSARFAARPTAGLVLGVSGSLGTFVSRAVLDSLPAGSSGDQRAVGFDAEYSRGHWLVRSEGIVSQWRVPRVAGAAGLPSLRAFAVDLEGRYRIRPGLYAAARIDRLTFSDISGAAGPTPWDLPVRRFEIGAGYSLWRNAVLKAEWQRNYRDAVATLPYGYYASPDTIRNLVAAQIVVWF